MLSALHITASSDTGMTGWSWLVCICSQVLHLSDWSDPGAVATDIDAYGVLWNMSEALSTDGVARVNTSSPTPPGAPYSFSISYTVRELYVMPVGNLENYYWKWNTNTAYPRHALQRCKIRLATPRDPLGD
jgi:hypothetical protein